MRHAIIFDCEFLTAPGAMARGWCGPLDPDPSVVQIGAVKLSLEADYPILDTHSTLIQPRDRFGGRPTLDPFFIELTGITQQAVDQEGISHAEALRRLDDFSEGASLWSWGKDELTLLAISCYVEGIATLIPASRFGNACGLLLNAGMPYDILQKTTSGELADYYGVQGTARRHHDALDDAMSVTLTLQHLLRTGRLDAGAFRLPLTVAAPTA